MLTMAMEHNHQCCPHSETHLFFSITRPQTISGSLSLALRCVLAFCVCVCVCMSVTLSVFVQWLENLRLGQS